MPYGITGDWQVRLIIVGCCCQTFPLIPAPGGENKGFSECARYHLAAKPRKGDGEHLHFGTVLLLGLLSCFWLWHCPPA
jgi:hypothetical protein